jgi:hypothetical protein
LPTEVGLLVLATSNLPAERAVPGSKANAAPASQSEAAVAVGELAPAPNAIVSAPDAFGLGTFRSSGSSAAFGGGGGFGAPSTAAARVDAFNCPRSLAVLDDEVD